jgi:hypothetical protein
MAARGEGSGDEMSEMDEFARREVLHMAHFFAYSIDEELCERKIIQNNPEWLALAERACAVLADLCQAIGDVEPQKGLPQPTTKNQGEVTAQLFNLEQGDEVGVATDK